MVLIAFEILYLHVIYGPIINVDLKIIYKY